MKGPVRSIKKVEEKPCPKCFAVMRFVDGRFECEKHGAPVKP